MKSQLPKHRHHVATVSEMRCGLKQAHDSERIAKREAARVMSRHEGLQLDTYRCPHCKRWHLTTKRKRRGS